MAEIKADKVGINSLFDDFWFLIPEYQRSYVWESDNINELLDDLWFAFKNKPKNEYFLGSLVLRKTDEKKFDEYEVLDGQQRLTTLFILMAVLRDITNNKDLKEACQDRIYQKENKFKKIPERIRLVYKIRDNVVDFIKKYILKENSTNQREEIKERLSDKNISIKNMANAIIEIHNFFQDKKNEEIEQFGEYLTEKPIFIYVSTENMEDAFRMFTILNDRGIPLTSADILKSINIGAIDGHEQEKYAKFWEDMENDLGEDFDRFLSFIRTIIVKEKARLNLLDEFNENIYKKSKLQKGKETIDLLRQYKEHFDKIITFQIDINLPNEYKNLLTIMQLGLPSTDWIPPLLYYFEKFKTEKIFDFLKKLEYKVSSDWIIQLTPTQRIDNINAMLKAIEQVSYEEDLLNQEKLFFIDKKALRERLQGDIYGRRFARYILLKYEYLLGDNTVHLSNYKTISVEHVLPQKPPKNSEWLEKFNEEERVEWTNKLANLILISKRKNSSLSNLDFKEKKEKYLKGRIDIFPSSKIFQTYNDWTVDILQSRQKEMLSKLIK